MILHTHLPQGYLAMSEKYLIVMTGEDGESATGHEHGETSYSEQYIPPPPAPLPHPPKELSFPDVRVPLLIRPDPRNKGAAHMGFLRPWQQTRAVILYTYISCKLYIVSHMLQNIYRAHNLVFGGVLSRRPMRLYMSLDLQLHGEPRDQAVAGTPPDGISKT